MKEALLYDKLENKLVQCNTCPRSCNILPNKTGFCKTRVNKNGKLYTSIYGVISKVSVDPIEDKPFYYFKSGTKCLSIGTYGCNFRCKGCQNAELSWGTSILDKLLKENNGVQYTPPEKIVEMAIKKDCSGIAFTFNEPAIWLEYVVDTAKLAKSKGLYNVYVTNSFISQDSLDVLGPHIDALATDIKSMEDKFYQNVCSVHIPAVKNVLNSISYAHKKWNIHIETRTNIIPGYNDDFKMLEKIALWIKESLGPESPWHITKFFPAHKLSNLPETPIRTLKEAQNIGWKIGLKNVNVIADKGCDCAKDTKPISFEEKCTYCCSTKKGD
jgi:pyruvate formate lyase activating enzyme